MQQAISLTSTALQYLQQHIAQAPLGTLGIRLGLRDAGCSGFAYTVDFANELNNDEETLEFADLKIFVAAKHLERFNGMEIDYAQKGVNFILEFNNPNVVNQCGCGESFQFK